MYNIAVAPRKGCVRLKVALLKRSVCHNSVASRKGCVRLKYPGRKTQNLCCTPQGMRKIEMSRLAVNPC